MLSTIIDGEADLADALFLIAVILFAIALVLNIAGGTSSKLNPMNLMFAGLTAIALAWLCL
jgi:hypothetical protein